MTEADFARWAAQWRNPPAPIVPVPALTVVSSGGTLRGARILIGLPGHGWRGEMRADSLILQGARSLVPALVEADWYRAERDRVEVVAALVPIERVWVETLSTAFPNADVTSLADSPRLVSLDSPPTRPAIPVESTAQITGRRLIHTSQDSEARGLRAVTEVHQGTEGILLVRVTAESDWYRWAATGQASVTRSLSANELWVE